MIIRALSGAIYVALIVAAVLCGTPWFYGLMALFTALAMFEMQSLLSMRVRMPAAVRVVDIFVALCLLTSSYAGFIGYMPLKYLVVVIFLYLPVRIILAVADRGESPVRTFMYSLLTLIYIALPLLMLYLAYNIGNGGAHLVLATFIFIWLNDTGAYLTGMSMGRHKLCERLSPKKTWEGFWGGFVLCAIGGVGAAALLGCTDLHQYIMWAVYAAAVSVVGTFGDLFESMIKRNLGVKDSGNLIPGHGGILDRIDSLLAVAPLAALAAALL